MRHKPTLVALVSLLCVFWTARSNPHLPLANESGDLVLIGAKIYPSPAAKPIDDGTVVIRSGTIAAVGKRSEIEIPLGTVILDCAGLTLTAGFWNSHIHFTEPRWIDAASIPSSRLARQLQNMITRYGFTTVFDTGSPRSNTMEIRRRIESGEVLGPRIFSVGEILSPKGAFAFPEPAKSENPTALLSVDTPEKAAARVRQKLDEGVDGIKIYATTWGRVTSTMPLEVLKTITAETHRHGKLVLAHPSNAEGLNAAIEAGVDVLVHTVPAAGKWSDSMLAKMRNANIALIPTLKLWGVELSRQGATPEAVRKFQGAAVEQVRAFHAAGGQVIFGTDVGYMRDYEPTQEYILMSQASMSFSDILASLTTVPAQRFGGSGRTGKVASGIDADLVLLEGDPALDITALAKVRYTLRKGKILYQYKQMQSE